MEHNLEALRYRLHFHSVWLEKLGGEQLNRFLNTLERFGLSDLHISFEIYEMSYIRAYASREQK